MKTRLNFWCGVAAPGKLAVVAAIMFMCQGLLGIPMVAAAQNLTNDSGALTQAAKCKDVCGGNSLSSFGDVSWGDANGFARSANFQDHFGIYASASVNDTENPGGGSGFAWGSFSTSLLVPPQQGNAAGDPGWLNLSYHLHGTVTIDWGQVFIGGMLVSGATARLVWSVSSVNIDGTGFQNVFLACDSSQQHNCSLHDVWSGNSVSATIDRDVGASIPIVFGEIFYINEAHYVTANGFSSGPPAVGSVVADFLHTGTLKPATVQDGSGNVLVNPIILSDTGFDFANLSTPAKKVGGQLTSQ